MSHSCQVQDIVTEDDQLSVITCQRSTLLEFTYKEF